MADYMVGYGKPPLHSRFKKGVCPNPKGRGKKGALEAGRIFEEIMNTVVEVSDGGKSRFVSRSAYIARRLAASAMKGNLSAAELLLKTMIEPEDGPGVDKLIVLTERELEAQRRMGKIAPGTTIRRDLLTRRW